MRQLKFRYVYRNIDTSELKIVIKDITQIEKDNEPYLDGWVLISRDEFTGLTDKNGKEIYEGDRVRHKFKRAWKTEYHESRVYWNQFWCCFYLFDGTSDYRMRDDIEYEVIGNEFESNNPELLTK